jgi:ubiquinone/menaquinone biosynthesis C-methylase UbiE
LIEGIPVFAPLLFDEFYERRYWNTELELSPKAPLREKVKLWIYLNFSLGMRRRKFMRKMLKGKKGLMLDLGCGAGKQFYKGVGPVIGVDICLSGLIEAKKIYSSVAQADALALPFADGLFDYVVSTDLIEHIPVPQKEKLFQEMWRVLKPGGLLIHEAETLSANFIYRMAQKDMDLFFKYFITIISGHFGLESAEELLDRFTQLGAKKIQARIIYDMFWPLHEYSRLFGEEYKNKSWLVAFFVNTVEFLSKNTTVKNISESLLGIIAGIFERFRKIKYAKDLGICFQKPSNK